MTKPLLLALALFTLAACDTGGPEPTDLGALQQDPALLVGAWAWERSTSYYTGDGRPSVQTPRSTGRTEILVFGSDGTLAVYRDGALERATTYGVRRICNGDDTSCGLTLDQGHYGAAWFGVDARTLVISTAYADGPETVYRRQD